MAERAVLVEFGMVLDQAAHAAVLRLDQALAANPCAGLCEAVPAFVDLPIKSGSLRADTVIKTRLDKKATNTSMLAAVGVRRDGQKVLLSILSKADEKAAWGAVFPPNGRRERSGRTAVPRRSG